MLNKNWITEHTLDFEYKQYQFLSYINKAESHFRKKKIQPFLSEITMHLEDLMKLKNERQRLKTEVNFFLSGINLKEVTLHYSANKEGEMILEPIDKILDFTEPILKSTIEIGKEIKQKAEQTIHVYPLGIVPLYKEEGIIILDLQKIKKAFIFEYALNNISSSTSRIEVKTTFIQSYVLSISNTLYSVKLDFLRTYRKIPVPATFVVESDEVYPIKETLLPIATQKLITELSKPN